jgi:hypothetical protein
LVDESSLSHLLVSIYETADTIIILSSSIIFAIPNNEVCLYPNKRRAKVASAGAHTGWLPVVGECTQLLSVNTANVRVQHELFPYKYYGR